LQLPGWQHVGSAGNPSLNGYPSIFNIELDPREEVNICAEYAWVMGPTMKLIGEYQKSLEKYLIPKRPF